MKTAVATLLLAVCAAAAAQDVDAQRRRIGDERAQVNAVHEAERKACYARFAVNDCLDAARQRRKAALADLRRQEVEINEADRSRRAAERQRDIEQRQREMAERKAAAPTVPAIRVTPPAPAAVPPGKAPTQARPRAKAAIEAPKPDAAEAERNRQAFEARRRQAEAHKAEVLERNAKRGKPRSADLPPPP